ncbi:MAG: IS21 family transposase [Desulfomonile tiedjei]|nr:IS21 family transposase [Desulfomonile tiedjei]
MAFKEITIMDIWDLVRRRRDGQYIQSIARTLGYDRKTVRKYLTFLHEKGVSFDPETPLDKEQIMLLLQEIKAWFNERPAEKQDIFHPYLEELKGLISEKRLKPKTAFSVLCQLHDLTGKVSYTSFKRFVRRHEIALSRPSSLTCRIEVEPGSQLQIDYGKMGLLLDPESAKVRTVYAFIATLSFSRHKYVEFTYSQDQQGFAMSHVRAFSFFGGVPTTVIIDNLKAGVISPSLYDPVFNRVYREMAEYHQCFIDPARVASPKDKGKVERDVQTVREQFKALMAVGGSRITLGELNQQMGHWLLTEYGTRKHGTTGVNPYPVFLDTEQPRLLPLPREPFEAAYWREAKVHPDHYIQVQRISYSVPSAYVGKTVWVKVAHRIVQIYHNEQLIKQHTVPVAGNRQTDRKDFPENLQVVLDRGFPRFLQDKAAEVGPSFARLVRGILTPHAFMNMRRAQGVLTISEAYPRELIERSARGLTPAEVKSPKHFRAFVEKLCSIEDEEARTATGVPLSEETQSFVRPAGYFQHPTTT